MANLVVEYSPYERPLVYKASGVTKGSLCYKAGGVTQGHLCYKAYVSKPGETTVEVVWSPQRWVCQTYNVDHPISFFCEGVFSQGSGAVSKTVADDKTVFRLSDVQPSSKFSITLSNDNNCTTDEDPGVTAIVIASQNGSVPKIKSGIGVALDPHMSSIVVEFDASKRLTAIN